MYGKQETSKDKQYYIGPYSPEIEGKKESQGYEEQSHSYGNQKGGSQDSYRGWYQAGKESCLQAKAGSSTQYVYGHDCDGKDDTGEVLEDSHPRDATDLVEYTPEHVEAGFQIEAEAYG